ncbi:unnamed protein product, partial [Ectocarpus sp. 12 AP-2014]
MIVCCRVIKFHSQPSDQVHHAVQVGLHLCDSRSILCTNMTQYLYKYVDRPLFQHTEPVRPPCSLRMLYACTAVKRARRSHAIAPSPGSPRSLSLCWMLSYRAVALTLNLHPMTNKLSTPICSPSHDSCSYADGAWKTNIFRPLATFFTPTLSALLHLVTGHPLQVQTSPKCLNVTKSSCQHTLSISLCVSCSLLLSLPFPLLNCQLC